jgi:hypothetical protein
MPTIHRGTFVKNAISPGITGAIPGDLSAFTPLDLFPVQDRVETVGSWYKVDKEDLQRIQNDGRVSYTTGAPLDDFGMTTGTYVTEWWGSHTRVTDDEIENFGMATAMEMKRKAAIAFALRKLTKHWYSRFFAASATSGWTADGTTPTIKWDLDGSDPIGDVIKQAVEPIADRLDVVLRSGVSNGFVGVCGKRVYSALVNHDQFRDFAGFLTQGPVPATTAKIATAMMLDDLIVDGTVEVTSASGAATTTRANVAGDGFLVLKVNQGPFDPTAPTAGVTLVSSPLMVRDYRNPATERIAIEVEAAIRCSFHVVDADLGQFIPNVHSGI